MVEQVFLRFPFFMLNLAEHKIAAAWLFILLINVRMPKIVGILTFISSMNVMLG